MDIPNHLNHKPIFKWENYSAIDGKDANKTDVQGLSIGLAQWSNAPNFELSAKVWRYTGKKWSRQSEEIPLHRVFDLASLLCSVIYYTKHNKLPTSMNDAISLIRDEEQIKTLTKVLNKEDMQHLEEPFKRLKMLVNELDF